MTLPCWSSPATRPARPRRLVALADDPAERARLAEAGLRQAAGLAGRGRGGRGAARRLCGCPDAAVKAEGEPGSVPMIRPPRLHLGREGTASRLELFFDLAYVLVIMQLAIAFVDDLSWLGLAKLAGLFVAIWFSWVGFTLYANRFDTDDLIFRLAKLLATGAIAGCAASAADAVGSTAIPFAIVLPGQPADPVRRSTSGPGGTLPDARPTINVYLAVIGLSSVVWAISIATPGDVRYLLWGVAVAIDAFGPALATLRTDKLPLHVEHLPERFALLVILVLGEAVGGGVRGVLESHWAGPCVAVAAAGFVGRRGDVVDLLRRRGPGQRRRNSRTPRRIRRRRRRRSTSATTSSSTGTCRRPSGWCWPGWASRNSCCTRASRCRRRTAGCWPPASGCSSVAWR